MIEEFATLTALVEAADEGEPVVRSRALRDLRESLQVLVDDVDARLAAVESERERGALDAEMAVLRLYEEADAREQAIMEGLITPEDADQAGVLTRDEIERLKEEGLLESVALGRLQTAA
jgi:hypothetical protein